jgi:hypothetical protein
MVMFQIIELMLMVTCSGRFVCSRLDEHHHGVVMDWASWPGAKVIRSGRSELIICRLIEGTVREEIWE